MQPTNDAPYFYVKKPGEFTLELSLHIICGYNIYLPILTSSPSLFLGLLNGHVSAYKNIC